MGEILVFGGMYLTDWRILLYNARCYRPCVIEPGACGHIDTSACLLTGKCAVSFCPGWLRVSWIPVGIDKDVGARSLVSSGRMRDHIAISTE